MVSRSGLDSVVKFHFIQTATTMCYCAEEIEESIDIRSDGAVRRLRREWNKNKEQNVLFCPDWNAFTDSSRGLEASRNNIDLRLTQRQWQSRHSWKLVKYLRHTDRRPQRTRWLGLALPYSITFHLCQRYTEWIGYEKHQSVSFVSLGCSSWLKRRNEVWSNSGAIFRTSLTKGLKTTALWSCSQSLLLPEI